MKILFISNFGFGNSPDPFLNHGLLDYQSDCLLHGFYNLLGENLTHTNEYKFMYKEFIHEFDTSKLYGKGFTIAGNLPKYLNDNSDIINKIKNKYFDFVIYGSVQRCIDYLDIVKENYSLNKICFIDGEDPYGLVHEIEHGGTGRMHWDGTIPYFKRELLYDHPCIYPISFSIPEEKITKDTSILKNKKIADVRPNFNMNYIFDKEEDYYNDYNKSYFGYTKKKGGWDCMRHYEILANYCVPYFENIESCPEKTLFNFPKKLIIKGNYLYNKDKHESDEYRELLNNLFDYTKNNLTTIASAKYVIDSLNKIK